MSTLTLTPCTLTGTVKIPASKSMGHRALICQQLAGGGEVFNLTESADIVATQRVLAGLLAGEEGALLDAGESGSTLRFTLPLAWALDRSVTFTGNGKLGERPLGVYYQLMKEQGIYYSHPAESNLPLTVAGRLTAGDYSVRGDISSQFISGLLFALPLLSGDSTLTITDALESVSYIKLTLQVLAEYGIKITVIDERHYRIAGAQHYQPIDYAVEGDYSQAAFFLVAGVLGGSITVTGLSETSLQGDRVIIDILRQMGAEIEVRAKGAVTARVSRTHGAHINAADCPDLVPILSVLAALSEGETIIYNAERLRLKESDRLAAMAKELTKLGANVKETADGLRIVGVKTLRGARVSAHGDHRIAMSLAIAAMRSQGAVTLEGSEAVGKSYPLFWQDYRSLGGKYE